MNTLSRLVGDLSRRQRNQVVVLAVVAGLARVIFVLFAHFHSPGNALTGDDGYFQPALALLRDHAYLTGPGSGQPEFLRTPGYPAFLASFLWIGGHRIVVVLLAQAVLSTVTVLLTYVLARRMGLAHGLAMVAGTLVAIDLYQIAITGTIATETLATLTTTLIALAGVELWRRPGSRSRAAWLGGVIVISTMVRPSTVYLPLVVIAVGLCAAWFRRTPSPRAVILGLCFLLPVVALGGYSLRNRLEFGSWSVASSEAITNYWYRAASDIADVKGIPWDPDARTLVTQELVPSLSLEEAAAYRTGSKIPPQWTGSVGEYYDTAQARGFRILLTYPKASAKQFVRGLYSQIRVTGWVSATRIAGVSTPPTVVDWASGFWVLGLNLLALAGLGATLIGDRLRTPRCAPALLALYLLLLAAGAQAAAGARMRAPITPVLSIYAVIACAGVVSRLWTKRIRPESEAG